MEIIHIVLGKANPDRMNGVNKVVNQLITRQVNAGYNAVLWGITRDQVHNYPVRNYETQLFRAYSWPFTMDPGLKSLLKKKKGKAVFHIHGGFNPEFFPVYRMLKKERIPFVFTPHGAYNSLAMEKSHLRKKLYLKFFERHLLQDAGYVHCLGSSEVDGLKSVYPGAKAMLLPYGFESTAGKTNLPSKDGYVIGFCGRLDIYTKGLDLLLQAYADVKKQIPHASLWIIGDGAGKQKIEKLIKELDLKDVWMPGSRFGEEKDNLLSIMHVFAHPSRNEGLPSAVLEAASLGIPSVITEATNLGDAVRRFNAGIVIKDPDVSSLANALLKMYATTQPAERKRFGISTQNMLTGAFNWTYIIKEFGNMYHSVWQQQ